MRLLVTGSRTLEGPEHSFWVNSVLTGVWQMATLGYTTVDLEGFTLIHGAAPTGLDKLADEWAKGSPMHSYAAFPNDRLDFKAYPDQPPFELIAEPADWENHTDGTWCDARCYVEQRRVGQARTLGPTCFGAGRRRNQ